MTADVEGPVWIPSLPPTLEQFLAPNLQPIPVLPILALILATAYTAGAVRLWTRGRRWSALRSTCFLVGCIFLAVVTGTGIEGYGYELFSVFMFQQLTLMMVIPPLLILGSPGTLLLRSTPHHGFGRLTLRIALGALRSPLARFALHPALVIPLVALTYLGLFLTGAADTLLRTWIGHVGLEIAFLSIGVLVATPLISADPLPRRTSFIFRVVDTFVEMQVHAVLGLVLILTLTPIVPFFAAVPESWDIDPAVDQSLAGVLAWTYGELPLLVILIVTLARWERRDTKQATMLQTENDAELDDYNAYLRQLSQNTAPRAPVRSVSDPSSSPRTRDADSQ
ncbi:cytochrome c oxidase assembly protein [Mycetocola zhadangensis]|uniref:cytochrome c oxidase assembly protein n=1 Tax=Mycetocola zhadangensis TaxID=1164595 RepID=UPI003A4DACE2